MLLLLLLLLLAWVPNLVEACIPGKYNTGGGVCGQCPLGKYDTAAGSGQTATACSDCQAGKYGYDGIVCVLCVFG
jgi:hypothetical protein